MQVLTYDYHLNYYPQDDVHDEQGNIDWSKVERVEIDSVDFVQERTCKVVASSTNGLITAEPQKWFELSCGHTFKLYGLGKPVACPVCGRKVNHG